MIPLSINQRVIQGCYDCPFRKEDGSPCDHPRYDVKIKFRSDQHIGEGLSALAWKRGEIVYGDAVIVNGVVYCVKAFATQIRGIFTFVSLFGVTISLDTNGTRKRQRKFTNTTVTR